MTNRRRIWLLALVSALGLICFSVPRVSLAQDSSDPIPLPRLNFSVDQSTDPQDLNVTLQIFFLLTVLSLAPSFLILTTSFTRFVVVFAFLRQGLAIPQIPPNQVLMGLALFLTFFVMAPVWKEINEQALQPYLAEEILVEMATYYCKKKMVTAITLEPQTLYSSLRHLVESHEYHMYQ